MTTVSIWKKIVLQFKTRLSHHSQIEYQTKSLETPIDTQWINKGDIKINLRNSNRNLKKIQTEATELRTQHLSQRASAMHLDNKNHSSETIINMMKLKE